ncbi:MAG TPA: hypothetical protein VFC54_13710 [Pseudolabrys sp.]|nr:hypothetical protein [Pseudolabrys sp.]
MRDGMDSRKHRAADLGHDSVRDYIGAMAAELAQLAYHNQLDALAVACDVVREIAVGNVSSPARHMRGPAGGKIAGQSAAHGVARAS